MRSGEQHIKAFTVFEITVVIAIMGILLTIITTALNRFNELVKQSSEVNQELNHFYAIRSNLWRELYEADSLKPEKNKLLLYIGTTIVQYEVKEEKLYRKTQHGEQELGLDILGIESEESTAPNLPTGQEDVGQEKGKRIKFRFIWKEEEMQLTYLYSAKLDQQINTYFQNLP